MWKFLRLLLLAIGVLFMLPIMAVSALKARLLRKRLRKPPTPLTEADLSKAQSQLGFALPDDLREFYLIGRFRGRAPCGEFYSLKGAVKEYQMLTAKPYGPRGQSWPSNLFPFADLLHGYAVYDRETGLITEWDPDEIAGGNESEAAWKRSFQPTGKSLAGYLNG